jgi:DNA-binding response OmpR family regulator
MLQAGDLALDTKNKMLYRNGDAVALTRMETRLLAALMRRSGQIVSTETIMGEVWGTDYLGDLGTLYAHVCFLRRKLGPGKITTYRRRGYALIHEDGQAEHALRRRGW